MNGNVTAEAIPSWLPLQLDSQVYFYHKGAGDDDVFNLKEAREKLD